MADAEAFEESKRVARRFWSNFERRVVQPEVWQRPRVEVPPRWLEWFRYREPCASDDAFVHAARRLVLVDTL